jgi:hypothetical protein
MNFRTLISLPLIAVLGLFAASGAHAKKQELPDVTVDGLHRVPDSKLAIVYAEPGADLAPYKRVQLLDAYVAFKKNWEREQRTRSASSFRVTSKDVEKIKTTLAGEFQKVFKEALQEAGYEVTDESGEDVMIVRPAIINLDVNAPDTPHAGRSTTYTSSAGEMTLYIELYDSVTGDIIAKALDRKADRANSGFYTWSNSVTNTAAAQRILRGWAKILVDALNEARTYGAEGVPDENNG